MCGIAGIVDLDFAPVPDLERSLQVMNGLQKHRGPDGTGTWVHPSRSVGFAHQRLSIIDLATGAQPMEDRGGNWITFNGEIYNFIELRRELGEESFRTSSDTEVVLQAYRRWGTDCLGHLRGMFAFALWDESAKTLFCARDRFGIKPFYYMLRGNRFFFSSEIKTLLPFTDRIETNLEGFKDYLAFQFCLRGKTLFKGIQELQPAHFLRLPGPAVRENRYWEVYYDLDFQHSPRFFTDEVQARLEDSIGLHLRSDVPVGAYLSGGLDSSIVSSLGRKSVAGAYPFMAFHGKFPLGPDFDESPFARDLCAADGIELVEVEITVRDFIDDIQKVIYHLDQPTAGPGSFPQFIVSREARKNRKVVLGGQGGDEIFGGYTRYLIAYFEQCIKAAIEGTLHDGNFVVTYESIIPNLAALRNYKPLLQEFWREGLFQPMDQRYFRLINRANLLSEEVNWARLGDYNPFVTFQEVFHGDNVRKESYFDLMTHFDFKTLLPALLHVEDRVSMAHGLESRVPFLDHPLVEFAATIPADVKFKDGAMKHLLHLAFGGILPDSIRRRKDKMGFPTPLSEWIRGGARDFVHDLFSTERARQRPLVNNAAVVRGLESEPRFSRKIWGLMSLELWHCCFHDREAEFHRLVRSETI